ncbi:MAG TPA: hypothetical protein VFG11_07505, partial [Acidobacteriota bacterium]|nr:hypothetical protein [Acidobacteriota bacterium]
MTQASVNRRLVRGSVQIDQTDFPVDPGYLRAVQSAGAFVKRESRWLNGVSAICDASCQSRVAAFPFVAEIRPVIVYH